LFERGDDLVVREPDWASRRNNWSTQDNGMRVSQFGKQWKLLKDVMFDDQMPNLSMSGRVVTGAYVFCAIYQAQQTKQ
jgi:hypothetical protein